MLPVGVYSLESRPRRTNLSVSTAAKSYRKRKPIDGGKYTISTSAVFSLT